MPNPRRRPETLPDFDRYSIDFNDSDRPSCFHLFWNEAEVATIRLEYDADGFLFKAIREGTRKQRYISLKDLANIPFFTTYIHRINLIDLISLINRIALIDTITSIGEVVSIGSMTLLDRITQLDKIHPDPLAEAVTNGTLETGDLTGWELIQGSCEATTDDAHTGTYSAKLGYMSFIRQTYTTPIPVDNITVCEMYAKRTSAYSSGLCTVTMHYTDDTETDQDFYASQTEWTLFDCLDALESGKSIEYVQIESRGDSPYLLVDDVSIVLIWGQTVIDRVEQLVAMPDVTQATRTLLKAQTEREDIVSLGGVASPSAAGVQIVAASGSLVPKVYDAEYEALADGLHYFYFGTSTTATTKRFLTRNTKGVNSKTFVQPRVGAAGDGIYLYSSVAETNMPYDLGYKLE